MKSDNKLKTLEQKIELLESENSFLDSINGNIQVKLDKKTACRDQDMRNIYTQRNRAERWKTRAVAAEIEVKTEFKKTRGIAEETIKEHAIECKDIMRNHTEACDEIIADNSKSFEKNMERLKNTYLNMYKKDTFKLMIICGLLTAAIAIQIITLTLKYAL